MITGSSSLHQPRWSLKRGPDVPPAAHCDSKEAKQDKSGGKGGNASSAMLATSRRMTSRARRGGGEDEDGELRSLVLAVAKLCLRGAIAAPPLICLRVSTTTNMSERGETAANLSAGRHRRFSVCWGATAAILSDGRHRRYSVGWRATAANLSEGATAANLSDGAPPPLLCLGGATAAKLSAGRHRR